MICGPSFLPHQKEKKGLKIVEMSLNFYQGTTMTHTTLQVSQSLFDSVVTGISAINEILIQSVLKIRFCNDAKRIRLLDLLRAWFSCGKSIYYENVIFN